MNREEYLKERELNALERIAESLEAIASRARIAESLEDIASHICKDDDVEKTDSDANSKYPGMEVSYL